MKKVLSLITSIIIHASVAWIALQMPSAFDFLKTRPQPKEISTIDFMTPEDDKPLVEKRPSPKRVKKKSITLPKPKAFYKRTKSLVTQKHESPVQVPPSPAVKGDIKKPITPIGQHSLRQQMKPLDARLLRQRKGNQPPRYPTIDRVRRRSGRVTLLGFINSQGQVKHVRVAESTGTPAMDRNAIKAFSRYQFERGQKGWVKMPFDYSLGGEAHVISVRNRALLNSIK